MPSAFLPFNQLRSGLVILLEALDWASASGIDPWDFAVEISRLRQAGLSDTHLRWLISQSYLEHAVEFTPPGDDRRLFRSLGKLTLRKRSCFILSQSGADFARPHCKKEGEAAASDAGSGQGAVPRPGTEPALKPRWDAQHRQLTVAGELVKRFKGRVGNQEMVLAAFEEEDWPPCIFDPLPPLNRGREKGRLHDTVKALNGHQLVQRLHFSRDGSGERVCWELLPANRA